MNKLLQGIKNEQKFIIEGKPNHELSQPLAKPLSYGKNPQNLKFN